VEVLAHLTGCGALYVEVKVKEKELEIRKFISYVFKSLRDALDNSSM
jgi:hypothetical protein